MKGRNNLKITLKLLSNPHGNVQRCPKNPQAKRSTSTGEETNNPKWKKENKGLNENGHEEFKLIRKVPRDCLREPCSYEPQEEEPEIN